MEVICQLSCTSRSLLLRMFQLNFEYSASIFVFDTHGLLFLQAWSGKFLKWNKALVGLKTLSSKTRTYHSRHGDVSRDSILPSKTITHRLSSYIILENCFNISYFITYIGGSELAGHSMRTLHFPFPWQPLPLELYFMPQFYVSLFYRAIVLILSQPWLRIIGS